jgi:hypothetical protein
MGIMMHKLILNVRDKVYFNATALQFYGFKMESELYNSKRRLYEFGNITYTPDGEIETVKPNSVQLYKMFSNNNFALFKIIQSSYEYVVCFEDDFKIKEIENKIDVTIIGLLSLYLGNLYYSEYIV